MNTYFDQNWGYLAIDAAGVIKAANSCAARLLHNKDLIGSDSVRILPWLQKSWLITDPLPRFVKTSQSEKLILDIFYEKASGLFHLYFRNYNEYRDPEHLWCEVTDYVIGVQKFIDTSYDGVVVADGAGKVLAVNNAFILISGLDREKIVARYLQELVTEGLLPYSCSVQAIAQNKPVSAAVRYPQGKKAVVSSTPLRDQMGRIIRIVSNIRDITDLNKLQEKLKSAKNLAKGYQRELQAIQATTTDTNLRLARSRLMERLYNLVTKVADTDLPLLITGESGVGKTALAKLVHQLSERHHSGNFIHVNCSAIPESLLESELFGYEEGAFTGAKKSKAGLFELANGGTLFLDEIGDMPISL